MGSKTAALPKKLQNAITERMRQSLLKGDTPFDKARLADAASFGGDGLLDGLPRTEAGARHLATAAAQRAV